MRNNDAANYKTGSEAPHPQSCNLRPGSNTRVYSALGETMNRADKNGARLAAAMVVLSPLLICQGIYVRRVTPKLPEADGPRSGEAGTGAPLRVLVLGDSAAAGVGVQTQEEALAGYIVSGLKRKFRVVWRVEAQTGATTRSTIARLKSMAQESFAAVAISLGVNDVTCGRRATTWLAANISSPESERDGRNARSVSHPATGQMNEPPCATRNAPWRAQRRDGSAVTGIGG